MVQVRRWIGRNGPQNDEVEGKSTVGELKNRIASATACAADKLDVMFCGQKLNDDIIFENCTGFSEKAIIYVVEKPQNNLPVSAIPSPDEAEALLTSLQATLMDPHHRGVLSRIISSGDTLQNLIDCVPGLRQDTVAQGILKDPYLLAHWVTDDNVLQHFAKHPCLYDACQYIMNCLHTEVVRHSGLGMDTPMLPPPPPPGVAVGDPFASDEEDEEEEQAQAAAARRGPNPAGAPSGGLQITPQQLAAALAMATGGAAPTRPQAPTNRQPSSSGASGSSVPAAAAPQSPAITTDMLQLAMRQALASAVSQQQQPQQQTQQSHQMQSQLQQLRDMGFLNPDENARALRASNGDVMAAVEFIISERERQEQGFGLD